MNLRTDSLVYLREFQASLNCIVRLSPKKKKLMIAIIKEVFLKRRELGM